MTEEQAAAPQPLPLPPPQSAESVLRFWRGARLVAWNLYAVPVTLLVGAAFIVNVRPSDPLGTLDVVLGVPWLVALHLHIWRRRIGFPLLWRIYAVGYVAWVAVYEFILGPATGSAHAESADLPILAILVPALIALFVYAFGDWESGSVQHADQADGQQVYASK